MSEATLAEGELEFRFSAEPEPDPDFFFFFLITCAALFSLYCCLCLCRCPSPPSPNCFEKQVLQHIKDNIPASLDPHQYAFRSNRSTEDAMSTALHTVFMHLENKNSYIWTVFVDFSSFLNTISPMKLIGKLNTLAKVQHFATGYWTSSQAHPGEGGLAGASPLC